MNFSIFHFKPIFYIFLIILFIKIIIKLCFKFIIILIIKIIIFYLFKTFNI